MTKDEVNKLMKEAGPLVKMPFDQWCERFANLVAAAEREAIAKLIEEYPYWIGTNAQREIAAAIRETT